MHIRILPIFDQEQPERIVKVDFVHNYMIPLKLFG